MHSFAPKYPWHVVATGALGKSSFPTRFEDLNYLDAFQDCKPQKETSHKSGCSSNGVVRILLLSFAKPQILPLWALSLWGQQTARCKNNKLTNPIQESATTNQFRASMQTKPRFEVYLHTCQTEREKLDALNVSGASLGCITHNVLCLCLGHYIQHIWCLYWLMDITCFSNNPIFCCQWPAAEARACAKGESPSLSPAFTSASQIWNLTIPTSPKKKAFPPMAPASDIATAPLR